MLSLQELPQRCQDMQHPDYVNLSISIVILLGMLVSYLPQHVRIISRGTSEGISPYFVLLGVTSATSGLTNILTVEPSRQDLACCRLVSPSQCAGGLLGIAQLGVQWICFVFILVLFLIYCSNAVATEVEAEEGVEIVETTSRQTALFVGAICCIHALIVTVVTGMFVLLSPSYLNSWSHFLGIFAAVLAAVQYIPQIITTYRLKHVGSLSIPMMCMQTPGGFLFALSLYSRLGPAGWSTWGIFVLTACMQGIVLVMAIYYELRRIPEQEDVVPPLPPRFPPRPGPLRTPSEAWDPSLPGPYTAHPERYAETDEELDRLLYREERAMLEESQPLLKAGGIGYAGTRTR